MHPERGKHTAGRAEPAGIPDTAACARLPPQARALVRVGEEALEGPVSGLVAAATTVIPWLWKSRF